MRDFKLSKIYKITNNQNDDVYIGSTIQKLSTRFNCHVQASKINSTRRNSKILQTMRTVGPENCKIEKIEDFPCDTKEELLEREQYYVDLLKPSLNMFRCVKDEDYEKKRDPVKRKLQRKKTYEKYKERILKNRKEYAEKNKDKIQLSKRLYREKNKEAIQAHKSIKCDCVCGSSYSLCHKARHERSAKHLNFIATQKD